MKRLPVLIAGAGAALALLAFAVRDGGGRPELVRRTTRPAVAAAARPDPVPSIEPPSRPEREELWGPLSQVRRRTAAEARRSEVLQRTTRSLGLGAADADAFEREARRAASLLHRAWIERDARVTAPEESAWVAQQRDAHDAYEQAKEEALRDLLALMSERREYVPLRLRVEEWVDLVR